MNAFNRAATHGRRHIEKVIEKLAPSRRPAVNDGPARFSSRLKPAGNANPASHAQGPSGPFPWDRRGVYGPTHHGPRHRRLFAAAALFAGTVAFSPSAHATRFFHGKPRQIRACVLLLPSTSGVSPAYAPDGQNVNPYVFYVMDQRRDLRPDSWEFVNPIAPPTVTQVMKNRWDRIGDTSLTVGIPLTKDLAAYWEVPLRRELIDRLVNMDVCYVAATGDVRVTYQDQELLRRLADAGVLLWFDNPGGLTFGNPGDRLFFPLNFRGIAGSQSALLPAHSLINGVFRLSGADTQRLGTNPGGVVFLPEEAPALVDPTKPGLRRQAVLTPIVGAAGSLPTVAAAQYGNGFLLATGGNVGGAITAGVGRQARAGTGIQNGQVEDLKLAYNAVGWTDSVTHVLKGPRRNNATGSQIASNLERWSFPLGTGTPVLSWIQPLIARNQVFAVMPAVPLSFQLLSFEATPNDDFNGDGVTDDGPVRDLSQGRTYDLLGSGPLADLSWISGLSYGEREGIGYVFVTGGEGGNAEGVSAGTTRIYAIPVPTPGSPTFGPPQAWRPPAGSKDVNVRTVWSAPAFFDGLLIAAGGTQGNSLDSGNPGVGAVGDMRALRLENGQLVEQWHYPQGNAPEVGPIVGPVVVANVMDPRSGATDTTVFYTSLTIASSPGGLGGIVIHTAGEPMNSLDDGRTWQPTRRVEHWDPNQWYEIRVIENTTGTTAIRYAPDQLSAGNVQFNVDNQPGRIRLPNPAPPNRFTVVAEYSLVGQREGQAGGVTRRYWVPAFNPPGGNLPASGVSAGPTVDAHGNAYMATGNGYVASLQFVGGVPRVNWKARAASAADGQYLGQQHVWEPYKPGRLVDHLFVSTPAWRDGILYVAGRDGVLYAFETRTDFTIKVPFSPGLPRMHSSRTTGVVLYSNEGDLSAGTDAPRTNRVPPDAYTVNPDAGTVTIHNMRNVTLDLARRTPQPLPALGNRYGIPISVDYTDENGQTQTDITYIPLNLLYRFETGVGGGTDSAWAQPFVFESSPVVAGDDVFIIGNRGRQATTTAQGPAFLFQLPADPRRLDNGFIPGANIGTWQSNPTAGQGDTTRPPGWMVHARPISNAPVIASPSIANDLMVIASGEGLTAYKAARALVADGNRVLEVSTDGKVAATMNATQKLITVGSDFPIPADREHVNMPGASFTAVAKSLDRPTVVRRLNRASSIASIFYSTAPTESGAVSEHTPEIAEESLLIADTGNNRIVETNPGGKVIWELSSFQDPFRLLPPGEPLRLSDPVDVQRWVDTQPHPTGGPPLLVIHTLVADAGNTRVIEIVDKIEYQQGNYGPNSFVTLQNERVPAEIDPQQPPIRWHHVLVWTSQTNAQGLRFRYRTAQRLYRSDENGRLVPNSRFSGSANQFPRQAMTVPPYLPMEPYESLTMATISNAKVFYVENDKDPRYGDSTRNIPQSLPSGDSIVFLRSLREEPFWEPDSTSSRGYKYVQGTVGRPPDYPIIHEIWTDQGGEQVVHQLNGVTSLQRTLRINPADRSLFSPNQPLPQQPPGGIYYLITDAGGVFEFRYDPRRPVDPPNPQNPFPRDHGPRLAWAFTNDNYNWVTGGGQGDQNRLRPEETGRYSGGQVFTATSARLLTNGQVLVTSRTVGQSTPGSTTATNVGGAGGPALGGEVMALRITDYPTWRPDLWVQEALNLPANQRALPSITWRAPSPLNPLRVPTPLPMPGQGFNPLDLGNTYLPDQPAYADLVF
jgi:hypothetical protein